MTPDWAELLREARTSVGLSRAELARRTGVSAQTIKAYELGRRNPSRQLLTALLDAAGADRLTRNQVLEGAGFAPDGARLGPGEESYHFTLEEATAAVLARRWPAHVNNEFLEVLAANQLMQRVWDVDLETEYTGPLQHNMLTVASVPRFADRIANWEEMVSVGVAIMKGHHRGAEEQPEGSSAYFQAVMRQFLEGDPRYVRRFLELWETVPAKTPKLQWTYPVEWDHLAVGRLRFEVVVSDANNEDGFSILDWVPVDAATWERLGKLME